MSMCVDVSVFWCESVFPDVWELSLNLSSETDASLLNGSLE